MRTIHNMPILSEQRRALVLGILKRGFISVLDNKAGRICGALLLALIALAAIFPAFTCRLLYPAISGVMLAAFPVWYIPMSLLTVGLFLAAFSRPLFHARIEHNLIRAGIINNAGEPPALLRRYPSLEHPNCIVWVFKTCGIPPVVFQDMQNELQAALNVNVVDVREGKDRQTIELYAVPPTVDLGSNIRWDDSEMANEDNIIVYGLGYMGKVTENIDVSPHSLISGTTGSGKSILMKCVLRQAILHGNDVILADFKGGIDYANWQNCATVITDEAEFLAALEDAIAEIETRKAMFLKVGARNITEYRAKSGEHIKRVFIAVDELAELFDTSGASKERKALLSIIENALSSVARLGRAFGFHLVLGLQRPDVSVLPPQIKACCDNRFSGRADAILSQITLGDARAHEQIPKHSRGRFINQDGVIFQGYNFQE